MPPEPRYLPRFIAEPPHEGLPYGRWAQRLAQDFLAACQAIDSDGQELGEPGEIAWYPDRTWHGRTYVPATTITSKGYELYGYVRFLANETGTEPGELTAVADYTEETAERNPDWRLDICEEVIGAWRGESTEATITLVWGRALAPGGRIATAELGGVAVDQCPLAEERFALIAPDDYIGDLLEIKLFDGKGREIASESLYEPEG